MNVTQLLPWVLFGLFFSLLLIKVPISVSLGASAMISFMMMGVPLMVVPQRIFAGLDSFTVLAIPLFILAGNIMSEGGISDKLVNVAEAALGHVKGGLAITAVLACAFFAAISGSGPATVVAIGGMLYPLMLQKGYPDYQMAGLLAVSGGLGPIIPPSICIVLYCTVTDSSIKALFTSGFLVGALIVLALMMVTIWQARRHDWPTSASTFTFKKLFASMWDSSLALIMPLVVLGGIYGGIFTPTEAAAVACFYSALVSLFVYRTVTLGNLLKIIRASSVSSSAVLFIIATSSIFSWLFAAGGISQTLMSVMLGAGMGYYGVLLVVTFTLLVFGCFLEFVATILLLIPLFLPVCKAVGIDPLHLGMIVLLANTIGCVTPPVAVNIFAAGTYSGLSVEKIAKGEIPYLMTMIAALTMIVFVPWLSTFGA